MVDQKRSYSAKNVAEIVLNVKEFYDEVRKNSNSTESLLKRIEEIPENVRKIIDPRNQMKFKVESKNAYRD
jgi:hypothetical protein